MLSFDEKNIYSQVNSPVREVAEQPTSRERTIQNEMIERIASRYLLRTSEDKRPEEATVAVQELFQGNSAKFESLLRAPAPPASPLFLTHEDETLFKSLFQSCPVCFEYLTVMDFLGLQTYVALKFLMEKEQISCSVVEKFCRDWLIGCFSDESMPFVNHSINYTSLQFVQYMTTTMKVIEGAVTKKNKKKYKPQYDNAINSIKMLIKIIQTESLGKSFLLKYTGNVSSLDVSAVPAKEDPEELYKEIVLFIEFISVAYDQTQDVAGQRQGDECMTALLAFQPIVESLKKVQRPVRAQEKRGTDDLNHLEKEELHFSSLAGVQRNMLDIFRGRLQADTEKQQRISDFQKNNKLSFISLNKVNRTQEKFIADFHRHHYLNHALQITIYMTDRYCLKLDNEYVTLRSRGNRLFAYRNKVLSFVLKAEDFKDRRSYLSEQSQDELDAIFANDCAEHTVMSPGIKLFVQRMANIAKETLDKIRPIQKILSKESHKAMYECFTLLINEFDDAFLAGDQLIHYARQSQKGVYDNSLSSLLPTEQALYVMIHDFFETLCPRFDRLQKQYNAIFIRLLDGIPVEVCQKHQQEIIDVVDGFLFDHLVPACTTYLLYQDLYLLTQPEGTKAPRALLETSIGKFLLNEEFEFALFQKATQSYVVKEPCAAIEPLRKEELSVDKQIKDVSIQKSSAPKLSKKPKQPKQSSGVSLPLVSHSSVCVPQSNDALTSSEWRIRRGEKWRKTLKKLQLLGFDVVRCSGSHMSLRNGEGQGCTVSAHGESLTDTVRRGLERQVNDGKKACL